VTVEMTAYLAHLVRRVIQVLPGALEYLGLQVLKEEMALRDRKAKLAYQVNR